VTIKLKHLAAKAEKRGMRKTVILKNDALRNILEEPANVLGHCTPAASICLGIEFPHFTFPINTINDRARLPAPLGIAGPIWRWTICRYKQMPRTDLPYPLKDEFGVAGPIVDRKQYRHIIRVEYHNSDCLRMSSLNDGIKPNTGGESPKVCIGRPLPSLPGRQHVIDLIKQQ
jgi:hypothetical protein